MRSEQKEDSVVGLRARGRGDTPAPIEYERIERLFCGDSATERAARAYMKHTYGTSDVRQLTAGQTREILEDPYGFAKRAMAFHEPSLI